MTSLKELSAWRLDNGHYVDPHKPASLRVCLLLCCYEPVFGHSTICEGHKEEMRKGKDKACPK